MMTGELKQQVDRLWDAFWSGGISNPLEMYELVSTKKRRLTLVLKPLNYGTLNLVSNWGR